MPFFGMNPLHRDAFDPCAEANTAVRTLTGQTLRERLNAGALPVRKTVEYAVQISRGVGAAYERGIAHRDLKPETSLSPAMASVK